MGASMTRFTGFLLACLFMAACGGSEPAPTAAPGVTADARWQYPRERTIEGRRIIVHAPQISSWDKFEHFKAQVAVEFLENDAGAKYGVVEVSGATVVDLKERLVKIAQPTVDRVTFTGEPSGDQEENI